MHSGVWFIIASLVLQLLPGFSPYQSTWQGLQIPLTHHSRSVKHDAKKASGKHDNSVLISEEGEEGFRKKKSEEPAYLQNHTSYLQAVVLNAVENGDLNSSHQPFQKIPFYTLYSCWKHHLSLPAQA